MIPKILVKTGFRTDEIYSAMSNTTVTTQEALHITCLMSYHKM